MTSQTSSVTPPAKPAHKPKPIWTNFTFQIAVSLVLASVLGIIALNLGGDPDENPNGLQFVLDQIGQSYVTLLRAAVVPLIFAAVVSSVANLRQVANAARLAVKTLVWFALTALIAVAIGITLGVVLQPGVNSTGTPPDNYTGNVGSWYGFLQGLIPQNFMGLEARSVLEDGAVTTTPGFNVLQVLVVSAAVGIAALKVGKPAEPFLNFVASLLTVIQKVLWWIIRLAPLGTIGLLGGAIGRYGQEAFGNLAMFILVIYIGLALVLFVVYPLVVKAHGLSIKQYFSGVWPAVQLGFVSRSSIGTMPLTQRVTERNLGVPPGYASFAVPLGATTKMDGCAAIYPAIAAIFVAQFYGIELSPVQYLLIVFVSVVGSAATAGTTGATVMLTLTLSTLGLPLAGVGLLLAVDPIIDMGRTAVNVAGQALIPTVVSKEEGILDEDLYNAKRSGDPFADETAADREIAKQTPDSEDDAVRL